MYRRDVSPADANARDASPPHAGRTMAPTQIPGPETSNAVMTALLIHDLNEPMHAGSPNMALDNPQQIFSQGSFHGGTWRCGYTFDSIGVPCVLAYYLNTFIVRNYLVLYNFVQVHGIQHAGAIEIAAPHLGVFAQACGWAFMMYKAAQHYADPAGTKWDAFGEPLGLFQNLAMLEVLHALLGMVRAPWFNTAIQIASRVFVVNLVPRHAELRDMDALYILAAAWGITEVNRYSWYGINLLGKCVARLHPQQPVRHRAARRDSEAEIHLREPVPCPQAAPRAHVAALLDVHPALPARRLRRAPHLARRDPRRDTRRDLLETLSEMQVGGFAREIASRRYISALLPQVRVARPSGGHRTLRRRRGVGDQVHRDARVCARPSLPV